MAYNVFLSFAMEDKNLVEMFRGMAKNKGSDLEFRDYSIKEPFDSKWKTNCERILAMCHATIVLIGRETYKSDAVAWEIEKTRELGKGLMGVRLVPGSTLPWALSRSGSPIVDWKIESIMAQLEAVAR